MMFRRASHSTAQATYSSYKWYSKRFPYLSSYESCVNVSMMVAAFSKYRYNVS